MNGTSLFLFSRLDCWASRVESFYSKDLSWFSFIPQFLILSRELIQGSDTHVPQALIRLYRIIINPNSLRWNCYKITTRGIEWLYMQLLNSQKARIIYHSQKRRTKGKTRDKNSRMALPPRTQESYIRPGVKIAVQKIERVTTKWHPLLTLNYPQQSLSHSRATSPAATSRSQGPSSMCKDP